MPSKTTEIKMKIIPISDDSPNFSLSTMAPITTLVKGSKVLNSDAFWGPIKIVPFWNNIVPMADVVIAKNMLNIHPKPVKLNVKVSVTIDIKNNSILPIKER